VHPWRPRRKAYGELVQWDTSDHDWLEGRGERVRYLVRLIDAATSRSWGRSVLHDGTRENRIRAAGSGPADADRPRIARAGNRLDRGIERSFGTDQDRLVKQLRLASSSEYLPITT